MQETSHAKEIFRVHSLDAILQKSVVSANVSSIHHAKVIGVLEQHRNPVYKKFQAAVLRYINLGQGDEVLVESPENTSEKDLKRLVYTDIDPKLIKGWDLSEVKDLLTQFKQLRTKVYSAYRELKPDNNSRQWKPSLTTMISVHNLVYPQSPLEPLTVMNTWVFGSEKELRAMKFKLIEAGEEWILQILLKFNKQLFPFRHDALTKKILRSDAARVVFFSGESHADPKKSSFSNEAKELIEKLSASSYIVLNPTLLDLEEMQAFINENKIKDPVLED